MEVNMDIEKLKEFLKENTKVDISKVNENSNFKTDLGLDSIDLLQLVVAVEEKLNIKLDNEKLMGINTISDALKAFNELLKQ